MKDTSTFIPMLPFLYFFVTQQSQVTLHQQHKMDKLKSSYFQNEREMVPSFPSDSTASHPLLCHSPAQLTSAWTVWTLDCFSSWTGMGNTSIQLTGQSQRRWNRKWKNLIHFRFGLFQALLHSSLISSEVWSGTPRDARSHQIALDFQTISLYACLSSFLPPQTLKHLQTPLSKNHQNNEALDIQKWTWRHLFSGV